MDGCGKTSNGFSNAYKHWKGTHNKHFVCEARNWCTERFGFRSELNAHHVQHNVDDAKMEQKPWMTKIFDDKILPEEQSFICDVDNCPSAQKHFSSQARLNRHRRDIHGQSEDIPCNFVNSDGTVCNKVMKNENAFVQHYTGYHVGGYKCSCKPNDKGFSSRGARKYHQSKASDGQEHKSLDADHSTARAAYKRAKQAKELQNQ